MRPSNPHATRAQLIASFCLVAGWMGGWTGCTAPLADDAIEITNRGDLDDGPRDSNGTSTTGDAPGDSSSVEPCSSDTDCDYLDTCCYEGACSWGTCYRQYLSDCCTAPGGCASSITLHATSCEEPCVEGGCSNKLILPQEDCGESVWHFEPETDALAIFELIDSDGEDNVSWHLSSRRGLGGGASLYAGDAFCPTYHTGPLAADCQPLAQTMGTSVDISLTSPELTLPSGQPSVLFMWLWLELEPDAVARHAVGPYDTLEVRVLDANEVTTLLWTSADSALPQRQWTPIYLDLSPFSGRDIRIQWRFSTLDGEDNNYEGVYMGVMEVQTPCSEARECEKPDDCAIPTMVDIHPIDDALCIAASPSPGSPCVPCKKHMDCTHLDPCVIGQCANALCEFTYTLTADCCDPSDIFPLPHSFEAPLGTQWSSQGDTMSHWHLSSWRAYSGETSLRFGRDDVPVIALDGASVAGTIWTPLIELQKEAVFIGFHTWISTEWDAWPSSVNPSGVDLLQLLVVSETSLLPTYIAWDSMALGGSTLDSWQEVQVDLSAFANQSIRIGFRFDTVDGNANADEGVYVDDVIMHRACPTDTP